MRIAHVLRRISFDDWGGTEQVVWNIAKAQKAAGHEVVLFVAALAASDAGAALPFVALLAFVGLSAYGACETARAGDVLPFVVEVLHRAAPCARAPIPLVADLLLSAPGACRRAVPGFLMPIMFSARVVLPAADASAAVFAVGRLVPLMA